MEATSPSLLALYISSCHANGIRAKAWLREATLYTSTKINKNEVGCRDDTVPKTVDTRRHCEGSESMQQSSTTPKN